MASTSRPRGGKTPRTLTHPPAVEGVSRSAGASPSKERVSPQKLTFSPGKRKYNGSLPTSNGLARRLSKKVSEYLAAGRVVEELEERTGGLSEGDGKVLAKAKTKMARAEVEIRAAEHRMRNGYFTHFDAGESTCRKRARTKSWCSSKLKWR